MTCDIILPMVTTERSQGIKLLDIEEAVGLTTLVSDTTRRFDVAERHAAERLRACRRAARARGVEGARAPQRPGRRSRVRATRPAEPGVLVPAPEPAGDHDATWGIAIGAGDALEGRRARVMVKCPEPTHEGECDFEIRTPDGALRHVSGNGSRVVTVAVSRTRDAASPTVPRALRHLIDDVGAQLRFWLLPDVCRASLPFMRATGLADCAGAAQILVEEAVRAGHEARTAFGVILSRPYCAPHTWAEVRVDGRWTAFDPVMTHALQQWGHLARDRALHAPLDGAVMRFAAQDTWLARHRGADVAATVTIA